MTGIDPKTVTLAQVRASKVINPAGYSWTMLRFFIPLSMPITVVFARMGSGPNQATLVRVVISAAGLGMMISIVAEIFWAGVVLYLLGMVLDYVDGNLARVLDKASHSGKSFDGIMDIAVELPLMLAVAIHFWRLGGDPLLLAAAGVSAIAVAIARITGFRSGILDRDVAADRAGGRSGVRTEHPNLEKWNRRLAGPLRYTEGRGYFHLWDLRYGGLVAALLLGWPEAWVYLIAAFDIAMGLVFVPARIARGFIENDVHRLSKSAAPRD